ncbi:MAG: hypothetical protein QM650_07835 [Microlunatus sp.]
MEPIASLSTAEVRDTVPGVLARLQAEGFPEAAAGTYVAGWLPASPAYLVGALYAETGAGLALTADELHWWLHVEGWTTGLSVSDSVRVLVGPGHPWSGQPNVETQVASAAVAQLTATALVAAVSTLVEAIRTSTRAGVVGLWHEVSDALATSIVERESPARPEEIQRLRELVAVPIRPWKRLPRIELVESARGPASVCHRGGCCQSFTATSVDDAADEPDELERAFQLAFPQVSGEPDYCGNCKFRSFDDVVNRFLWRRAQEPGG